MKSFFTVLMLSIITSMGFSQGLLSRAKSAVSSHSSASSSSLPSLSNIPGADHAIMEKLAPSLSLTAAQKPAISSTLTGFLKEKATILPLATTNPTAYASKFSALQSSTFGKLKAHLSIEQYTKFLSLKPKTSSSTNVLSNLFY
jgi:hypothetical protein